MTAAATVFDNRVCELGEGPLWHPERGQLFWFDINGRRMLSRDETGPLVWHFDEQVSAAGWLDRDTLIVASETALLRFDLNSGSGETIVALEADNPVTRSNDGRADPWGGFWIGTMGKRSEPGAGAIHRFYKGEIQRLYDSITIPNSICFSPDGAFAYFTDTPTRLILRQPLDSEGWPKGSPESFIDLTAQKLNPDGAVVDAEGSLWIAHWGASRVARYTRDGKFDRAVQVPALQPSCPAFGGVGLKDMFITTATEHMDRLGSEDGLVLSVAVGITGQNEHRVLL
jgi:sugar lactone lactonase YvrE